MATKLDQNALALAREEAFRQLEIIGGKLSGEEDIVREGTQYRLPEATTLDEDIQFLSERRADETTAHRFSRTYKYRPHDGARATSIVIRRDFGFTQGKTTWSFFGRNLPEFIDIEVGVGKTEQVPWGAMMIPGWDDTTVHLDTAYDQMLGTVFQLVVVCPRAYRWAVQGFFDNVERELATNSIYRGKAIDGDARFLDTSVVNPADVIFTDSIQARLRGDVWRFIRHTEKLLKRGMSAKYAVLFSGDYGTGKSLAALLTAQVAEQNGWTFLMARPGRDNLTEIMQMAQMYPPCVVFGEDVDASASASAENIEEQLDMLDGIKTKGLKLLLVLTTNHEDLIHKGMLRPGRIGAVIKFGAMDRDGVEKLARRVVGAELAPGVDFERVFTAMDGYMPAFVHEALNRSVRYAMDDDTGDIMPIDTDALVFAADGLRDQFALMQGASDKRSFDPLGAAMHAAVTTAVQGTVIEREGYEGERWATLVPAGSNGQ